MTRDLGADCMETEDDLSLILQYTENEIIRRDTHRLLTRKREVAAALSISLAAILMTMGASA